MNDSKPKLLLVGAGNVAWHLAPVLQKAGYDIVQVYSRTMESAGEVADHLGIPGTDKIQDLSRDADMLLMTVADDAIETVLQDIPGKYPYIVHTSGSMPAGILRKHAQHYGVMYPLMTFTKERPLDMKEVPFFLESGDQQIKEILEEMATKISGRVYNILFEERKKLHVAAIIATNFSNHMYHLASEYLQNEGLDFEMLKPLIRETTAKALSIPPETAQTGPARRGDSKIINSHLELLAGNPELQKLYTFVSDSIRRKYFSKE